MIINSTAISVTWEPVLANETNGIITMYSVIGITENPFIVNDTVLSVLFTELKEDFMYNFSVRAHTEIGFGPESPPLNIRTPKGGIYYVYIQIYDPMKCASKHLTMS